MITYTGTKTLKASPMTKEEYCKYRGWNVPENEDPNEEIYLVEYPPEPGGKRNHPDHEGYISMSPKDVFDKYYRKSGSFYDRLVIEHLDLSEKINKLYGALKGDKVPEDQFEILERQLEAMGDYQFILKERLN